MKDETCVYNLPAPPLPVIVTARRKAPDGSLMSPTNIGQELLWSNLKEPPAIGQSVRINFNSLGRGAVESYFTEHGWLGVIVKLDDPPDWHKRQTAGKENEGKALVFGIELEY